MIRITPICLMSLLCGTTFATTFATAFAAGPEMRYSAETVSGTRFDGVELHEWHDPRSVPRLDAKPLFAEPLRWVLDNSLPPAAIPPAYLEYFGGDRMPGRVIGYSDGLSLGERWPAHLLVEPEVLVGPVDVVRSSGVRCSVRGLKRVVWQKREDPRYRPGTLYFRDGRQIDFRIARFAPGEVKLLVDQETRNVPFGQIAEIHLPKLDSWEAWLDQVATLSPDGTKPLMQLETSNGLRVTTSLERFQPSTSGGGDHAHWRHLVQPVWSIEPLWVGFRTIRVWRFFAPHEVPLTAIEPTRTVQKTSLGGGWHAQLDRNVQGGPLKAGDLPLAWGLGVQAYSELEYPWNPLAKTFRTRFALDRVAGRGGCVKASVFGGPISGAPLWTSPITIGTAVPLDTGALIPQIAAPSAGASAGLTLVVDPVLKDRPVGADPLEIRDVGDWLQPLIELDPEPLKLELRRRTQKGIAAWQDWTIQDSQGGPVQLVNVWDQSNPRRWLFRTLVAPQQGFLTLSRRMAIAPGQKFLVLGVGRPEKDVAPSQLQVRINQRSVAEFEIPVRLPYLDLDPLIVPVAEYQGQTVQVDLSQMSATPQGLADWRVITLASQPPIIHHVFEDEPDFVDAFIGGEALLRLQNDDKFSGTSSLSLTVGMKFNPTMNQLNVPIREVPRLGEFRFLRFAWKKTGPGAMRLHLAQDGQWGPEETQDPKVSLRYEVGPAAATLRSIPIAPVAPVNWEVVTRDLFADFGPIQLTGLKLECLGGGSAQFDAIALARRPEDFDKVQPKTEDPASKLAAEVKPNVLLALKSIDDFPGSLTEFAPAFSTSQYGADGLWLLKEFRGRQRVLRTSSVQADKPCILRSPVRVPAGKSTILMMTVSHLPEQTWKLVVLGNGQPLHEVVVGTPTVPSDWLDVPVDLSRFAGQNLLLEIQQQASPGFYAFWQKLEVTSK